MCMYVFQLSPVMWLLKAFPLRMPYMIAYMIYLFYVWNLHMGLRTSMRLHKLTFTSNAIIKYLRYGSFKCTFWVVFIHKPFVLIKTLLTSVQNQSEDNYALGKKDCYTHIWGNKIRMDRISVLPVGWNWHVTVPQWNLTLPWPDCHFNIKWDSRSPKLQLRCSFP